MLHLYLIQLMVVCIAAQEALAAIVDAQLRTVENSRLWCTNTRHNRLRGNVTGPKVPVTGSV
jgi:hypothetical protein